MQTKPAYKKENPFINIAFSVAIPAFILSKMSTPDRLGPVNALIVALAFPIGYAIYDFYKKRKLGFIPALGFVSTLLTGLFALYELPVQWIAIKEASIPSVIGLAILLSLKTKTPLIQELLYNENVINVDLVDSKLESEEHKRQFKILMRNASIVLSLSFLLSAILNYVLAHIVLKSQPGTPVFNEELGRMHYLSWPVIVVPSTLILFFALWRLLKGLEKLTGLAQDEILNTQAKK
ncbi:MAG: MFS transporter [Proteobacteria bacterium]|nr:MAG: MFS transporter [Pseudomonadota bacterium]